MTVRSRHLTFLLIGLGAIVYSMISVPGCDKLITDHTVDTIVGHPKADFAVDTAQGCQPLSVSFTNLTSGDYSSHMWWFGDGDSSGEVDPVHTYDTAGIYTVTLRVDNPGTGGTDTKVKDGLIVVGTSLGGIYVSDLSPCAGQQTSVVPERAGAIDSFIWDFGDGGPAEISFDDTAVYHTYTASGSYTITLTAPGKCDTAVFVSATPVDVHDCPVAAMEADDSSGCLPLTVSFTDLSTLLGGDSITTWYWRFGDGNTSTDTNPVHAYSDAGEYQVVLTVTSSDGYSGTDTLGVPIVVYENAVPAFGSLASPTSCYSPYQSFKVKFLDQSLGSVDSVKWFFGDGDSSIASEPIHTYANVGQYDVKLITYGPCNTDSIEKLAYVNLTDSLSTLTMTAVQDPDQVFKWNFSAQADGIVLNWSWDFSNGKLLDASSGSITFDSSDTYHLTITASNDCNSIELDTNLDITVGTQ